jgi:serine/threonine-protein kinase
MARVAVEKPALAEATWHPDLLREIERDLATCIGPMATIALRRAARQTNDLTALYELLGKHIDNPREHAKFLAKGRRRAGDAAGMLRPTAPSKPVTEDRRSRDRPGTSPPPANIASIQSNLIRYIGPIARILVKRELEKYETLDKFYRALAAHIPNERDREAFLRIHGGTKLGDA